MEAAYLKRIWRDAKTWRSIWLGPITMYVRFARSTRLFGNRARRVDAKNKIRADHIERVTTCRDTDERSSSSDEVALVIGIGTNIGPAIARKLANEHMRVAVVSRNTSKLRNLVEEMVCAGRNVHAYTCDVTNEHAARQLLQQVCRDVGTPNLVVYGVQGWNPGSVLETEVAAFEEAWRSNCLGAFIIGRESARSMLPAGRGTLVLLGATSGIVGRPGYLNLAVGKFGLRALAQVMARELGPKGIHVVHVVIDADVERCIDDDETPRIEPADLAGLIWSLHRQPRSAWTSELDVRPFSESFWEHC